MPHHLTNYIYFDKLFEAALSGHVQGNNASTSGQAIYILVKYTDLTKQYGNVQISMGVVTRIVHRDL